MHQGRTVATTVKDRPGETTVPVYRQLTPYSDGSTQAVYELKFDDVPIPDRRYVADVGSVLFDGTTAHLLFGQKRVVGVGLRSLVTVAVSPDPLRRFMDTCDKFVPDLNAFLTCFAMEKAPLLEILEEPAQTVAVAANIIMAARAGREATLDFYLTSAASLYDLGRRERVAVDPILRVDLPTVLLAALLDRIAKIRDKLPPEIK